MTSIANVGAVYAKITVALQPKRSIKVMRKKRIEMSNKIKQSIQFYPEQKTILVPYNIKMVIYKHIGSQGGTEIVEPMFLKAGIDFGRHNWTMYNFMTHWLETIEIAMEVGGSPDIFELLFTKARTQDSELENFIEKKGGEITVQEMREFFANKNVFKWKHKNVDPSVVYIGKEKK